MLLRLLEKKEHAQTRALYERIFTEDSSAFIDFYYFIKTRDNDIFVIEEDGEIHSMIHLNPYEMHVGNFEFLSHYIVAVATDVVYRKRGYMKVLLEKSMAYMYANKEPFTFLMPAAEKIYAPYDFRFIYKQGQRDVVIENLTMEDLTIEHKNREIVEAKLGDGKAMALFFASNITENNQVYCKHDETYYQSLLLEQQSQDGGISLLKEDGKIVGLFAYGLEEEKIIIREPLFLKGYQTLFLKAVKDLNTEKTSSMKWIGVTGAWIQEEKPMIMARIIHLPTFLSALTVKVGERIDCSIAVIDTILRQNSRIWHLSNSMGETGVQVKETENSDGVITIGALTSLLFGYKTVEEIAAEEDVILTDGIICQLKKLDVLKRKILNEVV